MNSPTYCVREAVPADNAALLALDRQCVVAAATPVAFDRSPDFFARSRVYSHWRAYVAEGDPGLIGIGAMALKTVLVDDQPVQAAYFYDLRVAPAFRRLGVAKAVGDAIRTHTRTLDPAVGYSLVMEGNVPSLSFVQARGSRPIRSCALSLMPVEAVSAADPADLRVLDQAEAETICSLTRRTHPRHDLFPFPDVGSFRDRLDRLGGLGFSGLYGWESGGSLSGCFGLWDYSPVMRMRILQARGEWSWAAERDLHLVFLMPLGFMRAGRPCQYGATGCGTPAAGAGAGGGAGARGAARSGGSNLCRPGWVPPRPALFQPVRPAVGRDPRDFPRQPTGIRGPCGSLTCINRHDAKAAKSNILLPLQQGRQDRIPGDSRITGTFPSWSILALAILASWR